MKQTKIKEEETLIKKREKKRRKGERKIGIFHPKYQVNDPKLFFEFIIRL